MGLNSIYRTTPQTFEELPMGTGERLEVAPQARGNQAAQDELRAAQEERRASAAAPPTRAAPLPTPMDAATQASVITATTGALEQAGHLPGGGIPASSGRVLGGLGIASELADMGENGVNADNAADLAVNTVCTAGGDSTPQGAAFCAGYAVGDYVADNTQVDENMAESMHDYHVRTGMIPDPNAGMGTTDQRGFQLNHPGNRGAQQRGFNPSNPNNIDMHGDRQGPVRPAPAPAAAPAPVQVPATPTPLLHPPIDYQTPAPSQVPSTPTPLREPPINYLTE